MGPKAVEIGMHASCPYCPNEVEQISLYEKYFNELTELESPPTHIQVECPACGNVFYHQQGNWNKGLDGWHTAESRKTSPGKNVYISKERLSKVGD